MDSQSAPRLVAQDDKNNCVNVTKKRREMMQHKSIDENVMTNSHICPKASQKYNYINISEHKD